VAAKTIRPKKFSYAELETERNHFATQLCWASVALDDVLANRVYATEASERDASNAQRVFRLISPTRADRRILLVTTHFYGTQQRPATNIYNAERVFQEIGSWAPECWAPLEKLRQAWKHALDEKYASLTHHSG